MYLGYFDDDKRKPIAEKLKDGIERYKSKFAGEPTQVLCSQQAAKELLNHAQSDIEIKGVDYVRPHHFWIGHPDEV